ncbi:hypothetical protein EES38_05565 [Vibrio viridaestus]|uniref:Uncharacterized protein n=2 Tax=Vibrio viridaestus TaxID=2487322 RepID=A0A3N9TJT9_9VIBR|nr:hypothetical protein EES38_05565 [Vibrio viridaestus]
MSYCRIQNMEVSSKMKGYLDRIHSKVELGNYLAIAISSVPLIQLFSERVRPHKLIKNIGEYDWEEFGQAMRSVHEITRVEVNTIADEARLFSNSKESKFWKCVYEATR